MTAYTVLTWNLAMMQASDFAPPGWRNDQTEAEIRKLILAVNPDFVMFQELPGMVPFIETHAMVPANAKGQTGDLATLVRHDLLPDIEAARAEHAVLAKLKSSEVTLANVHLESGRGGDSERLAEMILLRGKAASKHLAVIGDTNTRTAEEDDLAKNGFLGERPPEPTWNGRINRFRHGAREFTAYFTRIFVSEGLVLSQQKVLADPVSQYDCEFHLSDHFPLLARIEIASK